MFDAYNLLCDIYIGMLLPVYVCQTIWEAYLSLAPILQ